MAIVYRIRNHPKSASASPKATEIAFEKALHRYTAAIKACPLSALHGYDDGPLLRRMAAATALASAMEHYREFAGVLHPSDKVMPVRVRGALP